MKRAGPNPTAFAELCAALVNKRFTRVELMEHCGIHEQTISFWIKLLRTRKLIYEWDWVRRGYVWTAVWAWGHPVLAKPRPKPLSNAEHCKTYRARKRKLGE